MSLTQYLNEDGINRTAVSAANPLPVDATATVATTATAAAPTYIEASDDNPLSVDLAGNLRVVIGSPGTVATEATLTSIDNTLSDILAADAAAYADTSAVRFFPVPPTPVKGMTAQMTGTTSTAVTGIGAGGANVFNFITQVTISNTDLAVGTLVELQDGSGGSSFYSFPVPFASAAGNVNGATFTFPTPLKQTTANTALYCKCVTTGSEVILSATGFQATAA